jgi:hypothetical protein
MAGGGGRSKSAMGHSAGASSATKLPPIGKKHGSAGLPNDARFDCVRVCGRAATGRVVGGCWRAAPAGMVVRALSSSWQSACVLLRG